jgi:hypothetical protein
MTINGAQIYIIIALIILFFITSLLYVNPVFSIAIICFPAVFYFIEALLEDKLGIYGGWAMVICIILLTGFANIFSIEAAIGAFVWIFIELYAFHLWYKFENKT